MSARPKVLLVEGAKTVRERLAKDLRDIGFNVFQADTAYLAQQFLLECRDLPLMICNAKLPDFQGVNLVEWAQKNEPKGNQVKRNFILMIGFASTFETKRAKELGVNNFLTLPVDKDFLLKAIQKIQKSSEASVA